MKYPYFRELLDTVNLLDEELYEQKLRLNSKLKPEDTTCLLEFHSDSENSDPRKFRVEGIEKIKVVGKYDEDWLIVTNIQIYKRYVEDLSYILIIEGFPNNVLIEFTAGYFFKITEFKD
ncbi:MAG: hypothetical protein ACPGN3_14095 [Opitutales bacterium]